MSEWAQNRRDGRGGVRCTRGVPVHRIHVLGASGSGTTTLGAELARRQDWRHVDADDYYWLPVQPLYSVKRDWRERLRRILVAADTEPVCVLTGSVMNWGAELEDSFDLIVRLEIPAALRLERLRAREMQRHGRVSEEFIAWAALYDEGDESVRSRRRVDRWLSERFAPVLVLEGDLTVAARAEAVLAQVRKMG